MDKQIRIDVVDVTMLGSVDAKEYLAGYILTTVQSADVPEQVYTFWQSYPDFPTKLAFTASSGRWEPSRSLPDGGDIISSASVNSNESEIAGDILLFFSENP